MATIYDHQNAVLRVAIDLPTGFDPTEHRGEIERLRARHNHTIRFIEFPAEGNCITRTLHLIDDPTYRRAELASGGQLARAKFVVWLLAGKIHEIEKPMPGDLAFYFNEDRWKHMGIFAPDSRVTSMWGTFPVYDHDLWEVPAQYGNRIRFFGKPNSPLQLILDYGRSLNALA